MRIKMEIKKLIFVKAWLMLQPGYAYTNAVSMVFWLIALVLLSLFVYVDVWYFVRCFFIFPAHGLRRRHAPLTKNELLSEYVTRGVVALSDLDLNLHMNNSKYLRELDFGRVALYFSKGLRDVLSKQNATILVNAINIRYRRSLQLFQTFELKTRIVCWEERALYLEQRMVTPDGFIAAIAFVKMAIRGTTAHDMIGSLCGSGSKVISPPPSEELKAWQESISLSSKHLKEESNRPQSSLSPSSIKSSVNSNVNRDRKFH